MFRAMRGFVALAVVSIVCGGCQNSTAARDSASAGGSEMAGANDAANGSAAESRRPVAAAMPVVQASAAGVAPAAFSTVTAKDVIAWSNQGVSDDVIVARIEQSNSVFRLSAASEVELRDARVSSQVIHAIAAMQHRTY